MSIWTNGFVVTASLPLVALFACSSDGSGSSLGKIATGLQGADANANADLGNSECAHFCAMVFGADTELAGECTSQAAHDMGLCFECGPEATDGGLTLCGQTCANLQTDVNNCGSCGNACPAGAACQNGACSSVCQNITGTGCYWQENFSGNSCWVPSPSGFPDTIPDCKALDSCSSNGGGLSGGGCYRWADCSLCSTIFPNATWP
jgi:hypothetical protein